MVREQKRKSGGGRKTAEERREQILEAAIAEFSARGLRGASVEDLAASVGVSQPYVYRLFGTKRELFLAATGRVCDRVQEAFRQAAEAAKDGCPVSQALGGVDEITVEAELAQ